MIVEACLRADHLRPVSFRSPNFCSFHALRVAVTVVYIDLQTWGTVGKKRLAV